MDAKKKSTKNQKMKKTDKKVYEGERVMTGIVVHGGKRLGIYRDWMDGLQFMHEYPVGSEIVTKLGTMAFRCDEYHIEDIAEDPCEQDSEDFDIDDIITSLGI